MQKNPWLSRARKFIVASGVAVVEIATVWANGPEWLYVVAPVIGAGLVYYVENAPKFVDPRKPLGTTARNY